MMEQTKQEKSESQSLVFKDYASLYDAMMKLAPTSYYHNVSYRNWIKELFRQYKEILQKVDESLRPADWDDIVAAVNRYCDAIEKTLSLYYHGLHSQAFQTLKEQLQTMPPLRNNLSRMLYRLRTVDDGAKPTLEGMFHIPFSRRYNVQTQRYSTPGLPSLYLGVSIYGCWEELGKPDQDRTWASKVKPQDEYCYINLGLPMLKFWENQGSSGIVYRYNLTTFPFVIASMVKVREQSATFKPEYIIPQLTLQWVLENRNYDDDPTKKPIGILYTSVHYDKESIYTLTGYTNFVIPAYYDGEMGCSKKLSQWFKISDPIPLAFSETARGTTKGNDHCMYICEQMLNDARGYYPLKDVPSAENPSLTWMKDS